MEIAIGMAVNPIASLAPEHFLEFIVAALTVGAWRLLIGSNVRKNNVGTTINLQPGKTYNGYGSERG